MGREEGSGLHGEKSCDAGSTKASASPMGSSGDHEPLDPSQIGQSKMQGKKDPGEASTCRPL